MSITVITSFEYDGGVKESKATNTQPNNYCIRAKDMNDISNTLNVLIDAINTHDAQIHDLMFSPIIDLSQYVTSIKLNGLTYQPTSGLIDLGNITAGPGHSNVSISKETTTSGTTLSWTIDDKTDSINIEKEKWLSDVEYNSTNKTIDFTVTNGNTVNIPVSEFINNKDFSLSGLAEKSYNSLDNIPTISGQPITGEISGIIDSLIKNNSQNDDITEASRNHYSIRK